MNFDHTNTRQLTSLFERCRKYFESDPRYRVLFIPVGKWGGPNDEQLDVCGFKEIIPTRSELIDQAQHFGLHTNSISEDLQPIISNVCYAARPWNFIIGADGKVMKCTEVLDTLEENVIGELSEDGHMRLDEDRLAAWIKPHYKEDSTCQQCFFVPVCQGASCPLPRVTGGNRPCPPVKLTIQESLKAVWRETSKNRALKRHE